MKQLRLFITLVIAMIAFGLSAQELPQAINFQAIARDANGQALSNANIMLQLTVIDGTPEGPEVYREIRSLQTNAYGGFNFQLGREPNMANGVFADIDWANGRKFLKVDYDPTSTMSFGLSLGTIEFISVPYAFVAGEVSYIDAINANDGDVLVFNAATGRFEPQAIGTSGITEETDPTVPDWAKEPQKPTYDYSEILNTPEIPEVPENVSAFTNDAGYITSADIPEIPEVPTNVSAFTNDANYITAADIPAIPEIPENVSAFTNDAGYITAADIPEVGGVPTNVSAFVNDANYITSADVPTNVSAFTNDAGYITSANIPQMPQIPTNVSAFNNDAGYITSADIPEIPENVSAFTNDANYLTQEVQGLPNVTAINNSAYTQIKNVIDPTESQDAATKAYVDALQATVNVLVSNINSLTTTLDSVINIINGGGGTPSVVTTPTVLTNEVSFVGENTAICGGIVIADGGAAVTAHGVCWSTTPNPTVGNSHTTDGTGTGVFTSNITGLSAVTTYYVRAYATNSAGTAYGEQKTFTTTDGTALPTVVTSSLSEVGNTTAVCGGIVTSEGNLSVTARGVCWSTSPNPTIANSKTIDGSGLGTFTSNLTDLIESTTYYIRAYATNSHGTAYGEQKAFTTTSGAIALPTVITAEISNITYSTATCGGNVTSSGGSTILARGVCWSTGQNPTIDNFKTVDGTGLGTFTSSLTGLTANTIYYARAYVTAVAGTAYGEIVTFATNDYAVPTVTTSGVTDVANISASCGGNVVDDGGQEVTARGVCWGTTQNPTIANAKTSDGTGTGTFTSSLTDLAEGTTYYVRAYATNSKGTAYGEQKTFVTTSSNTLVVITADVSDITTTSATCGGNVTNDGGNIVIARGVCWSMNPMPTTADSKTTDGYNTGIFTSAMTGLTPSTTYYVRAYATNSLGTVYGEEKTFTTQAEALPAVVTADVTDVTATTATCGGTVSITSNITVTARGVCWSTSPIPTVDDNITTDGSGAGSFTSSLVSLTPATLYYARAYIRFAENGVAYGETKIFMTNPTLPNVTTNTITNITTSTAVCGGKVTYDGGASVTARGVCWSTTPHPTISDSHTTDGTGLGSFTSSITGLANGTTYYVCAYATNSVGTAYGPMWSFRAGYGSVTYRGGFSISSTKKVMFSKGNLQYQATTDTWRFATSQLDYIGKDNTNISTTYTGWIDLFGWGTGNNPTITSVDISDYSTFTDWGDNPISNGGNQANQWRTLTYDEWSYLLNTRTPSSGLRYAKATVNGVTGLIVLPDDWSTSYYTLSSTNNEFAAFTTNTITSSDWTSKFAAHGAVFLPASGSRNGTSVSGVGTNGYYWSSTPNGFGNAEYLYFSGGNLSVPNNFSYYGRSVRLVQDIQ